jgi:hypothetical protein
MLKFGKLRPHRYTSMSTCRSASMTVASMSSHDHHHVSKKSRGRHKESSASVIGITHDYASGSDDYPHIPGQTIFASYGADELDEDDEGDDAEAIPAEWLPPNESAARTKKSPLLIRTTTPPKIFKASLKNFSGLEGVTSERLSTQDSLEAGQKLAKQASQEVTAATAASAAATSSSSSSTTTSTVSFRKSIPHDDRSSNAAGSTSSVSRTHRASDALFARVSKVTKKHSLDEEYLMPGHPPLEQRLSDSAGYPSTLPASQLLQPDADCVDGGGGNGKKISTSSSEAAGATSSSSARSCSLSDENPVQTTPAPSTKPPAPQPPTMISSSLVVSSAQQVSEQKRKFLSSTSASTTTAESSASSSSSSSAAVAAMSATQFRMSSSLPSTIPNLEENRVKIQVPGGMSNAAAAAKHHSKHVVKQASVDKGKIIEF